MIDNDQRHHPAVLGGPARCERGEGAGEATSSFGQSYLKEHDLAEPLELGKPRGSPLTRESGLLEWGCRVGHAAYTDRVLSENARASALAMHAAQAPTA